jgi:hypothetical protein
LLHADGVKLIDSFAELTNGNGDGRNADFKLAGGELTDEWHGQLCEDGHLH